MVNNIMKDLKTRYLTGYEPLDRHLIHSPGPFDWLSFKEAPKRTYTLLLYIYAKDRLSKSGFKTFMENAYPGGFYDQVAHYISNPKITPNLFFAFTKVLLENDIWREHVLEYIRTKPFSDQQNQELINYIKKNNLPYD